MPIHLDVASSPRNDIAQLEDNLRLMPFLRTLMSRCDGVINLNFTLDTFEDES